MITHPIYEPKGKAREYAELALEVYKTCSHMCKYCYNVTSGRPKKGCPIAA